MRGKSFISIALGVWAVGGGIALVHCVGDNNDTTNDGGKDATNDSTTTNDVTQPPDAGFTLSLSPGHVTEDPGDNFPVTINVNRANGFNDPVNFTVTPPPGLSATQPAPAGNSSLFYVATSADAGVGDYEITVTGSSTTLVQNVKLGVHVGSLLPIGDGGAVSIPQFATEVDVKMWGAGGGAGTGCQNYPDAGSFGGGGGYAYARVAVTGGATLIAVVGTGGGYNPNDCAGGGGGGGYSAVTTDDGGILVVAGGGGGAASIDQFAGYNFGGPGGGGGGVQAGNGGGACLGQGGGPDGGGAASVSCTGNAGAYLQGGNAPSASTSGGSPGGGAGGGGTPTYGNGAPGGGGGGYYGGASGGVIIGTNVCPPIQACASGGGGGGSGYNPFDGGVLTGADASAPPNPTDTDYVSGVGLGGAHAAGGPGLVIIRLPKP